MRAQIYGVFGTLALGMRILADDGVRIERMFAHGGLFRTAGVAQRFLAAALDTPVDVGDLAAEGGAWGIAVLAAYLDQADRPLAAYLDETVFAGASVVTAEPDPTDAAGFAAYLDRYRAGLAIEAAAITALPTQENSKNPKDAS
jgi:sugar (pentulose or hexulose) kinase